jgi:chromosome segregation ATPase
MKSRLRALLIDLRNKALTPVISRLEAIDARLDHITRRLDEIEAMSQTAWARTTTVTERSNSLVESQARIQGRIEQIERRLGERPVGT